MPPLTHNPFASHFTKKLVTDSDVDKVTKLLAEHEAQHEAALTESESERQKHAEIIAERRKTLIEAVNSERAMEEWLAGVLDENVDDLRDYRSFQESGVMTHNRGLVVTMAGGARFQITIVKA